MLHAQHAEVRAHVQKIRKQLESRDQGKKYVLVPGQNRFLSYWDLCSASALLYTAILTPFEVAFLSPAGGGNQAWLEPWFVINRILDFIFSVDIILQFFTAYRRIDPETGSEVMVENHSSIVRHYLFTWCFMDIFTVCVPSTFDVFIAYQPEESSDQGPVASNASIVRVLRILRLFKLVRLARASRLIKRWRSKITLSNASMTLIQCCLELLIATHWYACIFALQAAMTDNPESTWLGSAMYEYCDQSLLAEAQSTPGASPVDSVLKGCAGLTIGSWYLASFSWSIMIITGTGGTSFWPSPNSDIETVFVTLLVVMGAFLWTSVLARFCEVATNSNPGLTHFLQSLDDINHFSRINYLPPPLATKLREYMHEQRNVQLKVWSEKAIPQLSTKLQIEVLMHCHTPWLEAIWFVRKFESLCKVKMATSMERFVLSPGEVAARRHMYVINRGLVMYGMKVLRRNHIWGDDVLLRNEKHFSPWIARSMTYCEVSSISQEKLFEVVQSFPQSFVVMRRASVFLALRRHVISLAKEIREAPANSALDGGGNNNKKTMDFVSMVHSAAQLVGDVEAGVASGKMGHETLLATYGAGLAAEVNGNMSAQLEELKATCKLLVESVSTIGKAQSRLATAVEGINERLGAAGGGLTA